MAITREICEWELMQLGVDPTQEGVGDILDLFDAGDIDSQGSWEMLQQSINQVLEGAGKMPPTWRDYKTVLAEYSSSTANGDPPPAHPVPDPFDFGTPDAEEFSPEPVPSPLFAAVEGQDSEPPVEEVMPKEPPQPESTSEGQSRAGWWIASAVVVVLLVIGLIVKGVIFDDTAKTTTNTVPTATPTANDPEDTIPPTPAPTATVHPAPPPVEPETPPAPAPPDPAPPSKDTITVSCNVSRMLVGSCSGVPQGCQVAPSKRPKIKATCSGVEYCSQYGGPAAAPTGDDVALTLRTAWCGS